MLELSGGKSESVNAACYVTVGMFARRGLGSAKQLTLRSLVLVSVRVLSPKRT